MINTNLDSCGPCIKGVGSSNHCKCERARFLEGMSYVESFEAGTGLYLIAECNSFGRNLISDWGLSFGFVDYSVNWVA